MTQTLQPVIQLGDPVEYRGIVVAPLFPRVQPRASYVTFEEAAPLGFRISEVDEAGSVPQLLVDNPLGENVLLYDGEELVGAKQNRILKLTVLVPAHSKALVPVSCVEQGRWSRRTATFEAAPATAYPELRRRKAERLASHPTALGAAQEEVWQAIGAKSARMRVHSDTGAQRDLFVSYTERLNELVATFPLEPGQSGMLVAIGTEQLTLDYCSRPDAFARLQPKLLRAAMLDALERLDGKPAGEQLLAEFIETAEAAPRRREQSVGLGEDVRLEEKDLIGSGLELDGELLQLSAFSR